MTTLNTNVWNSAFDTAIMRVTVRNILDALVAVGLVQTADTGQVVPETLTKPASGQSAGYHIFRFNDAKQATAPVFIKVEYIVGGAGDFIALRIQVGTGTNGAGTLTGQLSTQTLLNVTGIGNLSGAHNSDFSGDGSRIAFVLFRNHGNSGCYWVCIERGKTADGADNDDIYFFCGVTYSTTSNQFSQCIPRTGAIPAQDARILTLMPIAQPTGLRGADLHVYPIYTHLQKILPPPTGAMLYFNPDLLQDTQITPSVYGVTRTYKAVGGNLHTVANGVATSRILIRWE